MTLRRPLHLAVVIGMILALAGSLATAATAHPEGPAHHAPTPPHATEVMRSFAASQQAAEAGTSLSDVPCGTDGFAGPYPCSNVDLLSYLPLSDIGGTQSNSKANDIWGWTDPATGKEYAIIGRVFGTSFIDISVPTDPVYLGQLPTHGSFGSSWRDIKVYADHAYIVSEALNHGMQVFDLTQLRGRTGPPVTFSETAHYNKAAAAHNIAINEDSGFAYIVGASGKNSCSGGLHMVDIQQPASPAFAGCFSADGYTHDSQCVNYTGPDTAYHGHEICFASNEDTVTIVDVTDKSNPVQLARVGYDGSAYTHQAWLTEDQHHLLLDDELDEQDFAHNTRTRIWDVADLDAPVLTGFYDSTASAIDHNQYVLGNYSYQANYRAGLRILDLTNVATAELTEAAFFDIYPEDDAPEFNGAWSNFPYFDSGVVIVSGIEQGLFVLKPNLGDGGGGGGGTTPTVDITSPADGATVSGSVSVTATASAEVTEVAFSIDGDHIGTDTDGTDGWSVTWDTTTTADGTHTLTATGSYDGGSVTDSISVTVDNSPDATMHVGDLDGSSAIQNRGGRWDATVTITVHDGAHEPLDAAAVTGTWSGGGSASCTTSGGSCSVTLSGIHKNTTSVTFTVDGVTRSGYAYEASANHDPDADSDGTAITVSGP